jgi:hypothetical protein
MVKMYRSRAQNLLIQVLACKILGTNARKVVMDNFHTLTDLDPPIRQAAYDALDQDETPLNELVNELALLINQDKVRTMSGEGDLIERIADILKLPWSTNLLHSQVSQLRKALLLPDELGKALTSMKNLEWHCGGCGRPICPSELVTTHNTSGGNVIYCARCVQPTQIACSGCKEGAAALPRSVATALTKSYDCGHATKVERPDTQDEDREIARAQHALEQQLRRARERAAATFNTQRPTAPRPQPTGQIFQTAPFTAADAAQILADAGLANEEGDE